MGNYTVYSHCFLVALYCRLPVWCAIDVLGHGERTARNYTLYPSEERLCVPFLTPVAFWIASTATSAG